MTGKEKAAVLAAARNQNIILAEGYSPLRGSSYGASDVAQGTPESINGAGNG